MSISDFLSRRLKLTPSTVQYRPKSKAARERDILADDLDPSTPFNLSQLKASLVEASAARRTLADDAVGRQKLLEGSAIDAAEARFKHAAGRMEASGLAGATVTRRKSIRTWMWAWLQVLVPRIEAEIKAIYKEEVNGKKRKCAFAVAVCTCRSGN